MVHLAMNVILFFSLIRCIFPSPSTQTRSDMLRILSNHSKLAQIGTESIKLGTILAYRNNSRERLLDFSLSEARWNWSLLGRFRFRLNEWDNRI